MSKGGKRARLRAHLAHVSLAPAESRASFGNPRLAALACAVWIVGRVVYAVGYWADTRKRGPGFTITAFALSVTWVAALISVLPALAIT